MHFQIFSKPLQFPYPERCRAAEGKAWHYNQRIDTCAASVCFFYALQIGMFYLGLFEFPPNPREVEKIWFANNWGGIDTVELSRLQHMEPCEWLTGIKGILPWAITCPAAIGWCVILVNDARETLHQPHQWGECLWGLDSSVDECCSLQVCLMVIHTMFPQLRASHQNFR